MDFYSAVEEAYKKGYRDGFQNSRSGADTFGAKKNERTVCAKCAFADKTLWGMTDPPQVLCTLTGKPRLATQLCSGKVCKEI